MKRLVTAGKAAARKLTHARILLLADGEDCPDEEVVSALGTSLRTVERVRKRLVTEGLEAAIDHKPQPPRPDKIKIQGDVEQKLIELACSNPPSLFYTSLSNYLRHRPTSCRRGDDCALRAVCLQNPFFRSRPRIRLPESKANSAAGSGRRHGFGVGWVVQNHALRRGKHDGGGGKFVKKPVWND